MGIDYLAIVVAAVVAFAVGALWYGPLFGRRWAELMQVDFSKNPVGNGNTRRAMAGSFVATLIMVFVLALFEGAIGVGTIGGGILLALWIWLGFVATIMSNMMWYERKPWQLYAINAAHYLVAIMVAAIILAIW